MWTGPNDAPLSTKEERMAELAKTACDHIIGIYISGDYFNCGELVLESDSPKQLSRVNADLFAFCPICGKRVAPDDKCNF